MPNIRLQQKSQPQEADPNMTRAEDDFDTVFTSAAELFGLLSTPIRLKILSALCNGEKNVSQLLADIDTTQPNMSQHLSTLYRAGVLGKRRDATQIYYRIENERAATLCRAVCTQIAVELDPDAEVAADERLTPRVPRR
jgi:DNA-binding transcriptional ArsR family regulator